LYEARGGDPELFRDCKLKQAHNFSEYLTKHRHRLSIMSIFRLSRFVQLAQVLLSPQSNKLTTDEYRFQAQWNQENVPQVLAHRCAYLNGLITI